MWAKIRSWFYRYIAQNAQEPIKPAPEPVKPVEPVKPPVANVLNDDPHCDLVIKYGGRDVRNNGQVTYQARVLTSKPFDGNVYPVCVQFNDTQRGEVTVWKDQSSRSIHVDQLPTDRGIDKIVVWMEQHKAYQSVPTPMPIPIPTPAPTVSGNNPDFDPTRWPAGWSTDSSRVYSGKLDLKGEFHGKVITNNATNVRYNLRSHFEHDLGYQTGYSTKGQININANMDSVTWGAV